MDVVYEIDRLNAEDWEGIRSIYLEGIGTGDATFETTAPPWEVWDKSHLSECRLAARCEAGLAGWAALSPVSSRCVYMGVAEVSVYVGAGHRGKGVGGTLLSALISSSEAAGVWTLQAGIFPENEASIALHKRKGFRIVGTRERVGKMAGRWRDVVLLERRSQIAGLD